jgi:hypothetical protein
MGNEVGASMELSGDAVSPYKVITLIKKTS